MKVVDNSHYHKFILGHIIHKISNAKIFTLLVTRVLGPAGGSCPLLGVCRTAMFSASLGDFQPWSIFPGPALRGAELLS